MDSNSIVAGYARLVKGFEDLVNALVSEREATQALIETLSGRINKLEMRDAFGPDNASQSVTIKIDGDIGERLDALEAMVENMIDEDAIDSKIEDAIDTAISDKVSDLELEDKIEEYIKGLSFSVTID